MSSDNVLAQSSDELASSKSVLPILIVDDDLAILELLRTVLQEEGFRVESANNAGAAFFVLERTPVGLIMTDYMMPGISGLDFADKLRRDPRTAAVPVILMSAFAPSDAKARVAAVISKPFALDELLDLVHQFWPQ